MMSAVREAVTLPALPALGANYEKDHTFSDFANWLLPGVILLGRYPYVEPSRCRTREKGEQQLEDIIRSGVHTFISLQGELPDQQQMKVGGQGGFLPYLATATFIASALSGPPPLENLHALRNQYLDKFLPPKHGQKEEAEAAAPRIHLEFAHSPIEDLGIPTADQMTALLADMKLRVERGEKLYVHCWGGRGRAGTVAACLLASWYGLRNEKEIFERVQRAFSTRGEGPQQLSPETPIQFDFVRQYIKSL